MASEETAKRQVIAVYQEIGDDRGRDVEVVETTRLFEDLRLTKIRKRAAADDLSEITTSYGAKRVTKKSAEGFSKVSNAHDHCWTKIKAAQENE